MIYQVLSDEQPRLGILGEVRLGGRPIYTARETQSAEQIVSEYEAVAVEKQVNLSLIWKLYDVLNRPMHWALTSHTCRSHDNETAIQIAQRTGREIIPVDAYVEAHVNPPLGQKLLLLTLGIEGLVLSPVYYLQSRHYGDHFEAGTEPYNAMMELQQDPQEGHLTRYIDFSAIEEMNRKFAYRVVQIMGGRDLDLLVLCNEPDLDRIVQNLSK